MHFHPHPEIATMINMMAACDGNNTDVDDAMRLMMLSTVTVNTTAWGWQ